MSERLSREEKSLLLEVFREAMEAERKRRLEQIQQRIESVCFGVIAFSLTVIALYGIVWWIRSV